MVDEPKVGKPKRTRAPSAYNKSMGEKIREGMTFSGAVDAWNR